MSMTAILRVNGTLTTKLTCSNNAPWTSGSRVEMKARVTRCSNHFNKLSDEIADWSLIITSRNPHRRATDRRP
jgi:hypothetical protein